MLRNPLAALFIFSLLAAFAPSLWAEGLAPTRTGKVKYAPPKGDDLVAERFRLKEHEFDFEQKPIGAATDELSMWTLTFPSPVETPHKRSEERRVGKESRERKSTEE